MRFKELQLVQRPLLIAPSTSAVVIWSTAEESRSVSYLAVGDRVLGELNDGEVALADGLDEIVVADANGNARLACGAAAPGAARTTRGVTARRSGI